MRNKKDQLAAKGVERQKLHLKRKVLGSTYRQLEEVYGRLHGKGP